MNDFVQAGLVMLYKGRELCNIWYTTMYVIKLVCVRTEVADTQTYIAAGSSIILPNYFFY